MTTATAETAATTETTETTETTPDPPMDAAGPAYRRWALVFTAIAGLLLVVMAVPPLAAAVAPLDDWFWGVAVDNEYSVLVSAAELLALIGDTLSMTVLVVMGSVVLVWQRRWPALAVWLLVFTSATVLNVAIKDLYQRPRPPQGLMVEQTWSFASGHSLTAAAVALMLVLVWVPAGTLRRPLLVVAAFYALIMAASRIYLRVHWFTDTAAGLAIGAGTALVLVLLAAWWSERSAA